MNRFLHLIGSMAFFLMLPATSVPAQNYKVSGKVVDKADMTPVTGAYVILTDIKDTTIRATASTDINGKFSITSLKKKSYKFTIQSISYRKLERIITLTAQITDLGIVPLEMESKMLNEVVVVGQGTAIQKGDTTIMTADAFKVNPDASAEDLVKKMPGITVENGTLKAQGEDVKKVLVDGKPFFGDDPSVALKNLPADVIDRVQVFNKLSDQAELAGFDDGESSKTINLITRRNSRTGQFGKFTAGTDFQEKYLAAGNLNIFRGPRRITITGLINNINQQNFSMQDLLVTGGGGGRYGRNRGGFGSFGSQSGITKTGSAGLNYTDNWGKKVAVNGSYFFNSTNNLRIEESNEEYLFITDGKYASNTSNSETKNYNHRFNLRIEYNIDSLNAIIIVPRLSLQKNSAENLSISTITGGNVNTQTINSGNYDRTGYDFSNDITWRHKFLKAGRTLSVRLSFSTDENNSGETQLAATDSIPDNQYNDGMNRQTEMGGNINYTEPLGRYTLLQFNYRSSIEMNKTDRETYQLGNLQEMLGRLDSLSNVFDYDYMENRGGISFLIRKDNLNASFDIRYQRADLWGHQVFPQEFDVNKTFSNFLPGMMMIYKFSNTSNLRVFYRTYTRAPSISQLQHVIDNSNRLLLSTGNPGLKQEYNHNLMTNYAYANPTSGFNAFLFARAGYTTDVIGARTIYAKGDTLSLPQFNAVLLPGGQLSYPVNLDHAIDLSSYMTFGYFLKPVRCNLNLVLGGSYSQSPGYIDSLLNRANSYSLTNSLIVTSNISSNLDFTLSYTSNYSIVKNSTNAGGIMDTKYWYQSASFKLNWIFWKGFLLQTDLVGQFNKGLSQNYNQNYIVWNASFGKKFLKNQTAELRFGIYDILNQNDNISRSVTASSITDTRVNTFPRYFLVLFIYNLRNLNGEQPSQSWDDHDHPRFPGGLVPGGRSTAGPPPDFRRHD
jgi:hypothetical protein